MPLAEVGEQDRVSECVKCLRYVQRDSPDLMSEIEVLHPLLGELKENVQGHEQA